MTLDSKKLREAVKCFFFLKISVAKMLQIRYNDFEVRKLKIEEKRMRTIKSLIFSRGFKMKDVAKEFGYNSYEGFKRAIKKNRKNKYNEVLKYLKD